LEEGNVDEETSGKIAEQWMEIADIDGSGTIDLEEFKEFLSRLEKTEDIDAEKIFNDCDENNSGELSVEGFG
jgi:Ca2+-binding EF-hand superfamily protein